MRFLALALLCLPGMLLGQTAEFSITGGVSRLNNANIGDLGTDNYRLKDGFRIGFRTTLNTWRYIGQEFGYGYNRTQLSSAAGDSGMAIHQGFFNFLLYATRDGSVVRPFVTGGGHFNNYTPPGTSVTSGGGSTKLGFNYGGGVKVRVSPIFAIRFDVRNYQNGKPFSFLTGRSGLIGQLEVSAGFGLVI